MIIHKIAKDVQRRTIAKIVVPVAMFGFFIAYIYGISNVALALNPNRLALDAALGQIARAESAQSPDELVAYVTVAKAVLPERGSIFWWSPEKANFESIQAELDDIIIRARNISSLDERNALFNSEMYDLHARLRVIQDTLVAF